MNPNDNGNGGSRKNRAATQSAESASGPMVFLRRLGNALLEKTGFASSYVLLSIGLALVVCIGVFLVFSSLSRFTVNGLFEVGKVADRDIIAGQDVVYIDEAATALRVDLERRQVPPVFVMDDVLSKRILSDFAAFSTFYLNNREAIADNDAFLKALLARYPQLTTGDLATRLMAYQAPVNVFNYAQRVLKDILDTGVVAIPDRGLELYNPRIVELRRWVAGSLQYEQSDMDNVLTLYQTDQAVEARLRRLSLGVTLSSLSADLAALFIQENVFFDENLSKKRLETVSAAVEPVMRRLTQGERIIRKGFVVTEQDLIRLQALNRIGSRISLQYALGGSFYLVLLFLVSMFFFSKQVIGIRLDGNAFYLVLGLAVLYFVVAALMAALLPQPLQPHLAALLPGALFAMLLAILINERCAILYTLVLSLSLLPLSGFNSYLFIHTFIAGSAGAFLVRRTEKRIDLVRAGAQLALIQFAAAVALGALFGSSLRTSLSNAIWQGLNAFFCGTLTLGFLPLLEHALNAATVFRLQELSDLNAPALKLLLTVAPGTYSHSVTVAHLAESACREIGASSLLARVGAYYHDIGKIEQPEYFIENQSGYNKHDDINPRLSATVLRSHVKFGLERAESLGLPAEVRAIIGEHHGTSLISYFFAQAQKDDQETSSDDYRYPGPLPGSRESAIVMLADCVEAASRTLKKPTLAKLEQFVKDMIVSKTESGQLARSALTFHDLEQIKNTFVRILASHFHSRIEYPRLKENGK